MSWRIVKSQTDEAIEEHARRRLERRPTAEILDWMDQAGSAMARTLSDFRRDGNLDSLEEAREGVNALLAGVKLLQGRSR